VRIWKIAKTPFDATVADEEMAATVFRTPGAFGVSQLIESLLFAVQRTDAVTIASVVAIISAVAAIACGLPAWRVAARSASSYAGLTSVSFFSQRANCFQLPKHGRPERGLPLNGYLSSVQFSSVQFSSVQFSSVQLRFAHRQLLKCLRSTTGKSGRLHYRASIYVVDRFPVASERE